MSHNAELVELLSSTMNQRDTFSNREWLAIEKTAAFYGKLNDKMLVEVTRHAIANCALRLAMNPAGGVSPTEELLKHSLIHTLDLLKKSVEEEYS